MPIEIPRQWQVDAEQWQAECPVACVKYRRLPDGTVQVYWVDPKVEMSESDAASVAAVAEIAIRNANGPLGPRAVV